jgi:membrane-bound lytic murein transglycosylase
MTAHPDEAAKERAANRSYVFFRVTGGNPSPHTALPAT